MSQERESSGHSVKIKPLNKEALLKLWSYLDILFEQICKETSIFRTAGPPPTYYLFFPTKRAYYVLLSWHNWGYTCSGIYFSLSFFLNWECKSGLQRENETEAMIFHSLAHSPNDHKSQSWSDLTPGTRSPLWASHWCTRSQRLQLPFAAFLGYKLRAVSEVEHLG